MKLQWFTVVAAVSISLLAINKVGADTFAQTAGTTEPPMQTSTPPPGNTDLPMPTQTPHPGNTDLPMPTQTPHPSNTTESAATRTCGQLSAGLLLLVAAIMLKQLM